MELEPNKYYNATDISSYIFYFKCITNNTVEGMFKYLEDGELLTIKNRKINKHRVIEIEDGIYYKLEDVEENSKQEYEEVLKQCGYDIHAKLRDDRKDIEDLREQIQRLTKSAEWRSKKIDDINNFLENGVTP